MSRAGMVISAAICCNVDVAPVELKNRLNALPLDALGNRLAKLRLCRPAVEEQMRRSLERQGQLTAVVAFSDGEMLQLIDGFKRLGAARQLGWTSLSVQVLEVDEAAATAVVGALHEHGGLTELEEGWVVHALCREIGLSQGAAAQLLGRHKSWVCRRLMLVEALDEAVQADVRLGLLSPRSALAVAALPRGNQRQAAELIVRRGMTTRQAESLVRELGEQDGDDARAALLRSWPTASNKHDKSKPRARSAAEHLMSDVAKMMRAGVRLEVRLLDTPIVNDVASAREGLAELLGLLATLQLAIRRALDLSQKVSKRDAALDHA